MSFNPDAIFISPSSISDFRTCAKLYFYRNVYRNPKSGLKIQLINPKLALGSIIHDVLAEYLFTANIDKTKQELVKLLNRRWNDISGDKGGFTSEDEENAFKIRALKMLDNFWANELLKLAEPVKLPNFPKIELGDDLILTGKLDWIQKDSENSYHVIDFKTGEKEERSDSLQMPIYVVLASNHLKSKNIKASYWYLDKGIDYQSVNISPVENIIEDLRKLGLIIKNVRLTNSYKCSSGYETCWGCRDFVKVANGEAKLVSVDYIRKQETYIIPELEENFATDEEELPF